MSEVADIKDLSNVVADLMDEFGLIEAELSDGDSRVRFSRRMPVLESVSGDSGGGSAGSALAPRPEVVPAQPPQPVGTPITSPMTGIFYSSPSPNAPSFVQVGDSVIAGQVVGLIEAMKVFNEITSPVSGKVLAIPAANGSVINPGEPLVIVG